MVLYYIKLARHAEMTISADDEDEAVDKAIARWHESDDTPEIEEIS